MRLVAKIIQNLELAYLTSLVDNLERQNSEAFVRVIGVLAVFLGTALTPLSVIVANALLFNSFLALYKMRQFRIGREYLVLHLTWKVKFQ